MTIYRGPGGGGNADSDAEINALTALTNQALAYSEAAELEADAAAASAAAASTSAASAATSASGAATSASNAASSASSASTSASSASTSATNASASASSASTSATNAASSASAASTSATNAASSATAAASSATTATTQAGIATIGAGTATTQASNAATSASAAAGSATTASTQASNAATSASGAATSATNASNSASAASTSAAAALASETAAAASVASIDPSTIVRTTGDQTIGGTKTFTGTITVPTPANATDASTKAYVDAVAQGLAVKESVRVATTAALPTNIYVNGASGVGATLTAVAFGALTVDSVAMVLNDRILVKDEAAAANNGIYFVSVAGTAGIAYVLTRSVNMDTSGEFSGAFCFTNEGTVNNSAGFVCTSDNPITVGTTAINFTQFSGAGQIIAGNGITKSGNTLSINTAVTADLSTVQTLTNKTLTTPVLTGIPTAPTATSGTNNTQVATTAYVNAVTGTNGITGFKNRIINGNFDIWQRGTSFSNPSGNTYTADRFFVPSGAGTSGDTISQQSFAAGQTDVPNNPTYFLRFAAGASVGNRSIQHRIEDVRTFAGQTCTLTFWAKASVAHTSTIEIQQNFGSGGSAAVTQSAVSYSMTTSWQKFTFTQTLPSISGKTIGTSSYVYIALIRSLGASNVSIDIAQIQFESGSAATSFDYRPYGTEFNLCLRYYEILNSNYSFAVFVPNSGYLNKVAGTWTYQIQKRATPSISQISGSTVGVDRFGIGPATISTVGLNASNETMMTFDITLSSSYTTGERMALVGNKIYQAVAEL